MATLLELCQQGTLDTIDPLEEDELPWRNLYATMDFLAWLDGGLPQLAHNELYSDLSPQEQVLAVFAEYVEGQDFFDDRRFKKLHWTPNHHIWEFKTDEVRIFGWVPCKNSFICCFGDSKDRIELMNSYGQFIARTVFIRNQMDLDAPKCIEGGNHGDVISNKA